ncbi:DUF4238 domain-containing protein [Parasediminibacterium sp. JCM 36343]|uniref:DUF4238 domain-containing protein n=1 Tax=Parasediminibacterium sp. JCM 36343 TaxID=3374279 RepID=UPI00397C27E7
MNHNNPRKHHYLPECYTKAFTNSQKQLWKRKKENNKTTVCTPAQIGYEIDTNKIRTKETLSLNGLEDFYYVEKNAFKKQENNYTNTLVKVIKYSDSPIVIDKFKYHLFLETLLTIKRRNPQSRNAIINAYSEKYNSHK